MQRGFELLPPTCLASFRHVPLRKPPSRSEFMKITLCLKYYMYNLKLKQTITLLATADILNSMTFDLIVVLSNIKNTKHVKKYSFEI